MKKYDLHVHTHYSDGFLSPLEILKKAKEKGLKGISITDHDSIDGFLEAEKYSKKMGVELIPGIEIQGLESEILGYFFDKEDNNLNMLIEKQKRQRKKYIQKKLEGLEEYGISIDYKEVLEKSGVGENPNSLHIAKLLTEKRYVEEIDDAFKEFLKNIPVRLEVPPTRCKKIIKVINDAGGKAVLPHPWYLKDFQKKELESFVINRVKEGLLGIEVKGYIPEELEFFKNRKFIDSVLEITKKYELIETGGSDFHGNGAPNDCELGSFTVSEKIVELLRK